MEDEILIKYFQEKMKQKDIARILNISKYKVCRIVNRDPRYKEEKERRKQANKTNHKHSTKQIIYKKREREQAEYANMQLLHQQASKELSNNRTISNRAFKNYNSSIYMYNHKIKSYILKKGINVTQDVPKKINWRGY